MIPIADAATRRELTKLHTSFVASAKAVTTAQEELASLKERAAALRQRIATEEQSPPPRALPSTETLAEQLAGDPSAPLDADKFGAAIDDQIAADRAGEVRLAGIRVLRAAGDKLAASIAAAEADLERKSEAAARARGEMLGACHAAYSAEFLARFAALSLEVIEPMIALGYDADVKDGRSLDHLDRESVVKFRTWDYDADRGGKWSNTTLLQLDYPPADFGGSNPGLDALARAPEVVQSIIDELGAKR